MTDDPLKLMHLDFTEGDLSWAGGRKLFRWWQDILNETGAIPKRSDFNPMKFTRYLPDIMLTDVSYDPLDFHIRLSGSNFNDAMGYNPTGMRLKDLSGGDDIHARYCELVRISKAYYALGLPQKWAKQDYQEYNTLILPLSDDGKTVNMLLNVNEYYVPKM